MVKELVVSKSKITIGVIASVMLAVTALTATASAAKPDYADGAKPGSQTITNLVVNNSSFDILEAAVIKAGLAGALDGNKQYTVFAPTDAAFIALLSPGSSEQTVIDAINGLPKEAVQNILLYHVYNGRHTSASVLASPSYKMLNGDRLLRSTVLAAQPGTLNISASNGVVHVINSVLVPPAN